MTLWIAVAGVSVAAHVAFAAWIDTRDPAKAAPRPATEMRLVAPKPRPKIVEPPPPPPPPPAPAVTPKPRVVRTTVAKPTAAPVSPAPAAGIDPDTQSHGDIAVATGSPDGVPEGEVPHAPPAPPPPPAPPAPRGPRFVPEFKVTRLPIALSPIRPELPASLRSTQRELHVTVEAEIDETGRVVHARVLGHAEPGLDAIVIAAVERTAFEPALVGTKPVPVRFHIPFTFRVHG